MNIEVVLTESEIAEEFAESLEARDLPEKFFYWLPPSPQTWRALSRDPYCADLNRSWKAAAASVGASPPRQLTLLSLGCGDGARDMPLLAALREGGCDAVYVAVDSSQTLLEFACATAEDEDITVTGIKADISSLPHLVYCADAAASGKLFVMAGCTLGALDPMVEVEYLAQTMHAGDRLLIDAEIVADDTIARRGHPAVRRYALAPLAAIGIPQDTGDLRFEQKRDERHEGMFLVTRHFHARTDLHAGFGGKEILIQKGERIALNFQYVYSTDAFRWLLAEHGGFKIVQEYPEGRYLTVLCEK